MRITHKQNALVGFVPDLAPDTLPPAATSYSSNLEPTVKGWEKTAGLQTSSTAPTNEKTHIMFWEPTEGDSRWVVGGRETIKMLQGGVESDASRAAGYNAAGEFAWNSLNFNGVIIFNNGADIPQYLTDTGKFADFPDLDPSVRARVVRKFKSYLLLLGVDVGAGFKPSDLYWSHPADPGTMPASWDYADPSKDAAITTLPSPGVLLDALELVDVNVIYKSDATFIQRFVGGQFVFRFDLKFASQGILATGCVAAFERYHFVLTASDIVIHDGVTSQSVADERVRRWFFDNLSREYYSRAFVVSNPDYKEILIFYPSNDSVDGQCDSILVWSWVKKTFHIRTLVPVYHAAYGFTTEVATGIVWDNEVGSWEDDTSTWAGDQELATYAPNIHVSTPQENSLLKPSETGLLLGEPLIATWERQDITIGPISRDGVVQQSYDYRKTISALHFNVETQSVFSVYIGTRDNLDDPVYWEFAGEVDPQVAKRLDIFVTTGFLSVRIETKAKDFVMRSLAIDYEMNGEIW